MTSADATACIGRWLVSPVEAAVEQSLQALARSAGVRHVAVMPDVHLAEEVCVGVVVATDNTLYPSAVGGDIGCGMAAIAFHGEAAALRDEARAARLLSGLGRRIPALKHGPATAPLQLPEPLERELLSEDHLERLKRREGRLQFATLGRGNHFIEFQEDPEGRLWLMVHSGSRAMGQAIREHHERRAGPAPGLRPLAAESAAGRAYLNDHGWALRYAELSRSTMTAQACELVEQVLAVDADWTTFFQCHHNHVQHEMHFGARLWVHRKGALAADEGTRAVIPGSMGSPSYHVTGRGHVPALRSSSHGAGRCMSRSEARRRVSPRRLEREMKGVLFDHRKARELCDEAPSAYRDIEKVMRAQRDLVRVERRLWPILSYKGA